MTYDVGTYIDANLSVRKQFLDCRCHASRHLRWMFAIWILLLGYDKTQIEQDN